MGHTTVRISTEAQRLLRELAEEEKQPMQAILERALEAYRRKRFLEQVNEAYAAEQATPYGKGQPGIREELSSLEGTLADGLDPSESWESSGKKGRPWK